MISTARRQSFVGRSAEIDLMQAALDAEVPPFSLLYVHGPAGIGKTSLLGVLGEVAARAGTRVVRLDGYDLTPTPVEFLRAAESSLVVPAGDDPITVRTPTGGDRLVLLLDSYELLSGIDDWVRTTLPAADGGDLRPEVPVPTPPRRAVSGRLGLLGRVLSRPRPARGSRRDPGPDPDLGRCRIGLDRQPPA